MAYTTQEIVAKANNLIESFGTRDPYLLARRIGVVVRDCKFGRQRGAYKVISRVGVIFLNADLSENERRVVLLHELGHDRLHKAEAAKAGGFEEYEIFRTENNRREYEANLFAAQLALDDVEFLEYCERGWSVQQIAAAVGTDVNLVALKGDVMALRGCRLRRQERRSDFLKYDRRPNAVP